MSEVKLKENETLLNKVINQMVEKATNQIIAFVVDLDSKKSVSENVANEIIVELANQTFMTSQLELTEKQKEVLQRSTGGIITRAYDRYDATIKKDERYKIIVDLIISNLKAIIVESILSVGEEVNRGSAIPGYVAKADISNPDKKKLEIHYSGDAKITVPTNGLFISSNCVEVLKDSVKLLGSDEEVVAEDDQE